MAQPFRKRSKGFHINSLYRQPPLCKPLLTVRYAKATPFNPIHHLHNHEREHSHAALSTPKCKRACYMLRTQSLRTKPSWRKTSIRRLEPEAPDMCVSLQGPEDQKSVLILDHVHSRLRRVRRPKQGLARMEGAPSKYRDHMRSTNDWGNALMRK